MDWVLIALVVGILQGVFEWLPISSEGNITLYLVIVEGVDPSLAVQLSLFLHAGTGLAASAYYRDELGELLDTAREWRPTDAYEPDAATLSFLLVGTAASMVIGLLIYLFVIEFVSAFTGGAFVALVGVLLLFTGFVQRIEGAWIDRRTRLSVWDALLVGALQGLAILPGVSRSGVTVGALLLRGHEAVRSFRLSFLLSIPAAFGAGILVLLDVGLPSVSLVAAAVALAASAIVGYLTIDALVRVARQVAFWRIAVALGLLAIFGGILTSL